MFSEKLGKMHRKALFLVPPVCIFIEMRQVFSFEFCQSIKNTLFTEHLRWLLLNIVTVTEKSTTDCQSRKHRFLLILNCETNFYNSYYTTQ